MASFCRLVYFIHCTAKWVPIRHPVHTNFHYFIFGFSPENREKVLSISTRCEKALDHLQVHYDGRNVEIFLYLYLRT